MTNTEAQSYAVVALRNLIKAGIIKTVNITEVLHKLDSEMHYLFDFYSEDEMQKMANRLLMGMEV